MKKIFLFFLSCTTGSGLFCQTLINLQLPESGLTLKSQLWTLSLVNTSPGGYNVQLQLMMTDITGNRPVLSALTKTFYLPKGIRQVQAGDIFPVIYTALDPAYSMDNNPNGFLPPGAFTFCYRVIRVEGEAPSQVGQECQNRDIEPLVPPVLISPADSEKIETERPVFTWTPPMPGQLFDRILYDWELVEVQGLQTGPEAIQQNIPLLYRYDIRGTTFPYPFSAPALDTNKIYAWRIIAKNNSTPVATSEIWNFSLKKQPPDTVRSTQRAGGYARLSMEDGAAFTICHGLLNYAYLNETNTRSAQVALFDITGSNRTSVRMDSATCALRFGDNLNQLDLTEVPGMVNGHFYLFELWGAEGKKWYLKFQYKRN
jgi:hypothetical protein